MAVAIVPLLEHCTDSDVGEALLSGLTELDYEVELHFGVTPTRARQARKTCKNLTMSLSKSPSGPKTMAVLAKDQRVTVRRLVATNPHCDVETLDYLIRWGINRRDTEVVEAVLENPSYTANLAAKVIQEQPNRRTGASQYAVMMALRQGEEELIEHLNWLVSPLNKTYISWDALFEVLLRTSETGVHLVDLLPMGNLANRVPDECSKRLLDCLLIALSHREEGVDERVIGYLISHHLDELASPPATQQCHALYASTTEACRLLEATACQVGSSNPELAATLRAMALASPQCPIDQTNAVLHARKPVGKLAQVIFKRELKAETLFQFDDLDRTFTVLSMLKRSGDALGIRNGLYQLDFSLRVLTPALGSKEALKLARLGSVETLKWLLPHINDADLRRLVRQPATAFTPSGFTGQTVLAHRLLATTYSSPRREELVGLLASTPGAVSKTLTFYQEHWFMAHVVDTASRWLGTNPETWVTFQNLGSEWEGTLIELVEVVTKMHDLPSPTPDDQPAEEPPLVAQYTLPLVFND